MTTTIDDERIAQHIDTHIGTPEYVYREIETDVLAVSIHVVEPSPTRNYYTLITSGMSARPMTTDATHLRYAELLICLPNTWRMGQVAFQTDGDVYYWPLRWLKTLARLPHLTDSCLRLFQAVPNSDPPQPLAANTDLCALLIADPVLFDDGVRKLHVDDDRTVNFYGVVPLLGDELAYLRQHGGYDLLEKLTFRGVTELVNVERRSVVP